MQKLLRLLVLFGIMTVSLWTPRLAASTIFSRLRWVDHIRFACSVAVPANTNIVSENELCSLARDALDDLAAGKLDNAVLRAKPSWASVVSPQSAIDKCRAQMIRPGEPVPAGVCEQDTFALVDKDLPFPLSVVSSADVAKEEESALTIVVQAIVESVSGENRVRISDKIVEPRMTNPPMPPHTIEQDDMVKLDGSSDFRNALHERFQIVWAGYFTPYSINELRAHYMIKSRQQ